MFLFTAFLLGFLGSLHCVGMCGPIALSLPLKSNDLQSKINSSILYNAGRILTYALLGLIFGLLGKGLALAGLQQIISLLTGATIILFVLIPTFKNTLKTPTVLYGLISSIKSAFQIHFQKRSYTSLFMIGLLNGLLPCGLVYAALLGATSTGSAYSGAAFMALFGLGTFPLMMIVTLSKSILTLNIRNKFRQVFPAMALMLGVLIFLRGLNLGIPYVSPKLDRIESVQHCH